jgi:5-methylcytosine-specific restriction endonuclease McrA
MFDALTARLEAEEREYYWQRHIEKKERRGEWWDWYNRYLKCSPWLALRQRVLTRDGFRCRICRAPAEQVHHLTYARVGYEELGDLVSVCTRCHERAHL